jgi:hypothetical protein
MAAPFVVFRALSQFRALLESRLIRDPPATLFTRCMHVDRLLAMIVDEKCELLLYDPVLRQGSGKGVFTYTHCEVSESVNSWTRVSSLE